MHRGIIPKHLHYNKPNPHIDWEKLPVRVVSEVMQWPDTSDRPPRAGVSAFALSGTNAHVVVEGYVSAERAATPNSVFSVSAGAPRSVAIPFSDPTPDTAIAKPVRPRRSRLLPLSAKSGGALRDMAQCYLAWFDEHGTLLQPAGAVEASILGDLAWTASTGRTHFAHRAGIVFDDATSLRRELQNLAACRDLPAMPPPAPKIAFAYGAGHTAVAQWCQALYEREPAARAVLDQCDMQIQEVRATSLLDVMFRRAENLNDPMWRQLAVYALQCAVTALWASIGVRPSAVFGAEAGELAAAQAAGALTLAQGMALAERRGVLFQFGAHTSRACRAGISGGDTDPFRPLVSLVSGRTGQRIESGAELNAEYWIRRARTPTNVEACAEALAGMSVTLAVGIDPTEAWTRSLPRPGRRPRHRNAGTARAYRWFCRSFSRTRTCRLPAARC